MKPTTRRHCLHILALCLVTTLFGTALTACGNGGSGSTPPAQFFAPLRGTQERPTQVATLATGALTATISSANTSVHLEITTQSLPGVTSAEVRVGKPGVNGPVIFTLYTVNGNSVFPARFTQDLTASNLTPQPSIGINTITDAINAMLAGNTYVNISTQANPTGELRGQVGPASFSVTLSGASVVPPVTTGDTAIATVSLNAKQSVLTVNVQGQNLQKATHIALYVGQLGGNGPQIFPVFDSQTDGAFTGSVVRTLTETDLQKQTTLNINTYSDAVNAFLSGNTYILITTTDHSSGDLRAQLIAQ